ncbi:protein D2 [Ciona intestinalis]
MESAWSKNELDQVEDCPKEQANVKFNDFQLNEIGQITTPTVVQNEPTVTWTTENGKFYSIFMTDPDAPSRAEPKFREWYHWGVVNVPGTNIKEGQVVAEYVGAGPPEGTDLHRYVFLVYEQNGKVETSDKIGMVMKGRDTQKIRDIANKYKLGRLVAAACFQAQHDDYVPLMYAKFQ